jgi:ABC-type nitrate/sulfonate/bicarbonate transport system substrate-binding protein
MRGWLASSAAITALALGAAVATPTLAVAADEVTFVIPTVSFTFTAAYVAQDAHIWEKNDLKVSVRRILGIGALNAVIAGSADFTLNTGVSLTRAAARGQRLLAVANTIDKPMLELVIRKDIADAAGFDPKASLKERGAILKGHTFSAGGVNSILHAFLRVVALKAGLDPEKDMRFSPMEASAVFPAFRSKAIDGFALSQPYTIEAVANGEAVVVASAPKGDLSELTPFGYDLVITRPEVCEKRPQVCEKMGQSMKEAVDFIFEHPKETMDILRKRFPTVEDKFIVASYEMMRDSTPRPPVVSKAAIENSERFNILAKLMKPEEKLPSYDGLFTGKYVK